MCNFLSALYLRTGKLICKPQYTDSHAELMEVYGVVERNTAAPVQHFVKLELTPPDQGEKFDGELFLAFEKWVENVDEREVPDWFDAAARFTAFDLMRDILRAASERSGRLQFGGLTFVRGSTIETRGSKVVAWAGSKVVAWDGSEVDARAGSTVVARAGSNVDARDGSKVDARAGSNVDARAGSKVDAWDGSNVDARAGSKVVARDGSKVVARAGSKVDAMSGSNVDAWAGSTVVKR